MPSFRNSQLPKEVVVTQSAVADFAASGVVTTTLTDLEDISFYNNTSAAITVTVMDGNSATIANISAYPVDPASPIDLQFRIPQRCVNGVVVFATSVGLSFSLHGWKHPGFTATSH